MRILFLVLIGPFFVSLTGCGDDAYRVAPVKGRVTCNGVPVQIGTVCLTPKMESQSDRPDSHPGKPALGYVESDGTFVLTTYEEGDGALLGSHAVAFQFPDPIRENPDKMDWLSPEEKQKIKDTIARIREPVACGAATDPAEFIVVAGQNELEIKLTPKK